MSMERKSSLRAVYDAYNELKNNYDVKMLRHAMVTVVRWRT